MNLDESEHYPPGPKIAYSYQNNPHRDPPNMRKISTNSQTYSVFLISFYFLSVFDYTLIHSNDGSGNQNPGFRYLQYYEEMD